jgi:hypothetical protein
MHFNVPKSTQLDLHDKRNVTSLITPAQLRAIIKPMHSVMCFTRGEQGQLQPVTKATEKKKQLDISENKIQ